MRSYQIPPPIRIYDMFSRKMYFGYYPYWGVFLGALLLDMRQRIHVMESQLGLPLLKQSVQDCKEE